MKRPDGVRDLPDPHWWRSRLAEAAAALDDRLRAGGVERAGRARARAVLQRAYAALESVEPDVAQLESTLRAADALASPVPLFWPACVRRPFGARTLRSAVDAGLVDRVSAYAGHAERLSARIDAFLEVTGGTPLRLFVAEVRTGDREPPEMAFTEG
jgi:hypothetical protein